MRRLSTSEKRMWSEYWYAARSNMPRKNVKHAGWTTLATLVGYKTRDPHGRNNCSLHMSDNAKRGSAPRSEQGRTILRQLAGPYGRQIAIAMLIARGEDITKYKH